jgi:glycosyltransferase involved in cell wall biosynthesis
MKLAIVLASAAIAPTGGVRIQGLMWRDGLSKLGHSVQLINYWESNDWKSYDAIIVIGFGQSFRQLMKGLSSYNIPLIVAPILDPDRSKLMYKFLIKWWGFHRYLGLTTNFHDLYLGSKYASLFLTRSDQESEYLSYCCDVPTSKIKKVPLSFRINPVNSYPNKESFCFHASRLAASNKNVKRLILAAKKYKFKLVLAGVLYGAEEKNWLEEQIKSEKNISYVGVLSDEELRDYYIRAKVFALPSLVEGVGMVALEAAACGCEVILTNIGAPKEYYNGMAKLVDPFSVDDIGKGILECTENGFAQPLLCEYIKENYSSDTCSRKLELAIKTVIGKK